MIDDIDPLLLRHRLLFFKKKLSSFSVNKLEEDFWTELQLPTTVW